MFSHWSINFKFHFEVAPFAQFGEDIAPVFIQEDVFAGDEIFMVEGEQTVNLGFD